MTADRGPNSADATRLACTKQYRDRREYFVTAQHWIETRDPRATAPDQLWLLGLDPVTILARALDAELINPTPKADLG